MSCGRWTSKVRCWWQAETGPLSVIDDHSRYLIRLQQIGSMRAELVQEQLVMAFCETVYPQAMLMDHGTPWWSLTSATSHVVVRYG